MALIRVRAKASEANPNPSDDVLEVDEAWLERWPEDFEPAPEGDAPTTEQPTGAPAQAPSTKAPAAEQPSDARSRF